MIRVFKQCKFSRVSFKFSLPALLSDFIFVIRYLTAPYGVKVVASLYRGLCTLSFITIGVEYITLSP